MKQSAATARTIASIEIAVALQVRNLFEHSPFMSDNAPLSRSELSALGRELHVQRK